MKKQEEKIIVKCPKCGEEIDIRDILENERVRDRLQEDVYKMQAEIKIVKACRQNFETGICKIQTEIEKLSKSDSEENKNMILVLKKQIQDVEQIKQKITELIEPLEMKIKSFETEINNNNFTCPDFGADINNIKVLLKRAISLINSQEMFLNEIYRLKDQLNDETAKIRRLFFEQKMLEEEKNKIQKRIEKLSEKDFEKEKNMVSKLKKQIHSMEQMTEENTSKIRKTEEKIKLLQKKIKLLEEEMHEKNRKDKSK